MLNGNHTRNGVLRRSCWDPGFPLLPTRSVCTFQRFQDWPQCSLSTWQMLVHLLLGSRASCAGFPLVCRISPAKIPKPADVSEPAKAQLQLHCPVPGGPETRAAGSPASMVHPRAWRKENCQTDSHLSEESPAHHLKTQQFWAVNGPESSRNPTGALHGEAYFHTVDITLTFTHLTFTVLTQGVHHPLKFYHSMNLNCLCYMLDIAKAKLKLKKLNTHLVGKLKHPVMKVLIQRGLKGSDFRIIEEYSHGWNRSWPRFIKMSVSWYSRLSHEFGKHIHRAFIHTLKL